MELTLISVCGSSGSAYDLRSEFIQSGHADVDAPTDKHPDLRPAACPWSGNSKQKDTTVFSAIRANEIRRVAVPIIKRYAGDPEANSFLRAEQLVVKI